VEIAFIEEQASKKLDRTKKRDLPSISSTFNARVFRTKFWRQKTQVLCAAFLVTFCQKKHIRTKNARVKYG